MGAILSQFTRFAKQRSTTPLLSISLSKLREYHGNFKSICDNFTLDLSDFELIFGVDKSSFSIWDTDGTELIDALELFCGLVIFSDSKFEDKIRFLFDLFDFNELNSLSAVDLEIMISACLSSTFKIYGIKQEINDDLVGRFINEYFIEDSRINISQLVTWCVKSPEIHEFFSVIKKDMGMVRSTTGQSAGHAGLDKLVNERKPSLTGPKKTSDLKAVGAIFNNQRYKIKLDYLSSLVGKTQHIKNEPKSNEIKDTIISMNWVFGFRCNDVRHPLKYIGAERGKAVPEKLIYFTGCIVVVYDPKSNEQIHYLDHEREVISLAVSQSSLVATGELGETPAIHIWDCDTLQNVAILKGIHSSGIHLLAFMKDDEFLVSCGVRPNSPLLIYNIKDTSLVLSTYLIGFALDLQPIVSYVATTDKNTKGVKYHIGESGDDSSGNSFFTCTKDAVFLFTYENGIFNPGELKISDYPVNSSITCCVALRVNAMNPYFKAYANERDKSLLFLTGHSDGKVLVWENMLFKGELIDYRSEILAITCLDFGVVIATDSSFLYFWDLNLKNNFKKFDLCSLQFKLFSFKITGVAPAKNKMYLATTEGDVVEISLSQKKELHKNTYTYKIQAQKLNNISRLSGGMKAITLVEKDDSTCVFVAGDSAIVSAFSLENHDLIDFWSLGESITAIDIVSFKEGSNAFAMGTLSGKIHLRYDWEVLPQGYECQARILDLKFSHDGEYLVAISEHSKVFIFTLVENSSYFDKKPREVTFDMECPISVNFSDDNQTLLIETNLENRYILDLNEPRSEPINLAEHELSDKTNFSVLNMRYPSHAKNFINTMQPVSFGMNSNAIISADESGIIFYWKDRENLINNCGGYLKGHGSQVSRLCLAKNSNIFYSLGATDRTLIEWRITTLVETEQPKTIVDEDVPMKIEDETLIRELEYSTFFDNLPEKFKDSIVFFRATTDKTLNSILRDHVEPFEGIALHKRVPNLSLELHFVYGFQSYEKRNTIFYGHYAQARSKRANKKESEKEPKSKEDLRSITEEEDRNVFLNKNNSLFIHPQTQKLIMYAKETPGSVSFDYDHEVCDRYFVYFVSRIAIIFDPRTNKQRFYEGHRNRITAMCMHPSKSIVATGDTSLSPTVHIWSLTTLEPLKTIKTSHKNGILSLQFSKNGAFLVTVGIDLFFSVQVTKWKSEEVISFRNTDRACIFDVTFNPYDKCEFATVGQCNIAIWGIEGRSLVRKEWINIKNSEQGSSLVFTAATYFNHKLRKEIGSDIVVGDNAGNIGLVTAGKYYHLKEKAHAKMINCIKVTELLADDLMILTSGQDETVKFWDTSFNLLYDIRLRDIELPGVIALSQNEDASVQSIDVYRCGGSHSHTVSSIKESRNELYSSRPMILFGTRNGYVLEATVNQPGGKTRGSADKKIHVSINKTKVPAYRTSMTEVNPEEDSSSEGSFDDEPSILQLRHQNISTNKMSLNFAMYLSSHNGTLASASRNYQQKVLYALHPKLDVMFTVGEDQYLCVWDIEKCTLLKQVKQDIKDSIPTALKITNTPDGEILAIGFNNGTVILQDARMSTNPMNKYQNSYILPSLNFIQGIKGQVPVLNIEFSSRGDMMAISFDNPKVSRDGEEDKASKEGSYIDLYVSRASHKFVRTRMSEKNLYHRYGDIKSQSLYQTHETDVNQYGIAAYYMTFSLDEYYLLIYYQAVDNNQIRVNEDTQGHYAVWDLAADNRVWNSEMIKNIHWRKLNFPNSLYAQYMFYPNIMGGEDGRRESLSLPRRPIISSMFNYSTFIVAGSTLGDIHFFKERALHFDQDFVLENVDYEKMCMSKTFNAHVSFVNQVESKGSYLFSTGIRDGCVMQWRFIEEEEQWEADFRDFNLEQNDPFLEVPTKEQFNKLVNETLPLRQQVYEIQQNVEEIQQPEISLELDAVIGRKAFNRRNNLYYDFYERIIYAAGTLLVMYNPRIGFELDDEQVNEAHVLKRQEFLKADEGNVFSSAPEISAYTLSSDKRFLCAGTQERNARIIIWEICSRTCIKTIKLGNCTAIHIIRFAFDSQHICALGTSPEYTQMVYLIDSAKPQILGCVNLLNTLIFKIKDINFFPNATYKFITCGVQHMNIWKYSGSSLTFSACPLENPKENFSLKSAGFNFDTQDLMQSIDISIIGNVKERKGKDDDDLLSLEVTFLCMCFVQNLIIAGGEDGFIYVWKDFKIIKKQTAHFKCSVLCLSAIQTSNIFVSGGQDGRVIIWNILKNTENNSFLLEMLHDCPITPDDITKAYLNLKNHVQSVFIDNRRILAGTRTGNIYEIVRQKKNDPKTKKPLFDKPKTRLICLDDEIPKCIGFSHNMDRIYGITQKGLFCVWNIKDLQLSYSKHLSRITTSMIVFKAKAKPYILIAFETEAWMLNATKGDYAPDPSYNLIYKSAINDIKVSYNEKYLAVALAADSNSAARIEMYDLEKEPGTFKRIFTIDELTANVQFLDFSLDNMFLLYKNELDEAVITDIYSTKKINAIQSRFDFDWISDGIQISEKTKGVHSYYGEDNKILKMVRLGQSTLIVTDEMGTIRLFKYPCEEGDPSGYYKCYTEHMNNVNNCVLSSDQNYLLTTSERDKSIFLWKVKNLVAKRPPSMSDT